MLLPGNHKLSGANCSLQNRGNSYVYSSSLSVIYLVSANFLLPHEEQQPQVSLEKKACPFQNQLTARILLCSASFSWTQLHSHHFDMGCQLPLTLL